MSEWVESTLGDLGQFVRGRRFTKDEYVDNGLGCIHYGQVHTHFGPSATESLTFLPEDARGRLRLAAPGDVVIAATSENTEDLGKATAWLGTDDVAVHDDCYIFKHHLDPRFASLLFASPAFHHQKIQYAAGTKVTRISGADLARIEVAVPPLVEQRRIVDVMVSVDSQIRSLAEEMDRAGLCLAVARANFFDASPQAPLLDLATITAKMVDPRLPEFENMPHVGVDVIEKGTGRITDPRTAKEDRVISGKYLFEPGQVIFSKIRPALRKVALADFHGLCSADAYPLTAVEGVPPALLREALLHEPVVKAVIQMSGRTKMPKVNRKELFSISVAMPEVDDREVVAAALATLRSGSDALRAEIERLRMFRSALLGSLLNQDIEIPENYDELMETIH